MVLALQAPEQATLFAIAYFILQTVIIKLHDEAFPLRQVVGSYIKGKISIVCYLAGIGFAFLNTWIAIALYSLVAIFWLVPDKRIEKVHNSIS